MERYFKIDFSDFGFIVYSDKDSYWHFFDQFIDDNNEMRFYKMFLFPHVRKLLLMFEHASLGYVYCLVDMAYVDEFFDSNLFLEMSVLDNLKIYYEGLHSNLVIFEGVHENLGIRFAMDFGKVGLVGNEGMYNKFMMIYDPFVLSDQVMFISFGELHLENLWTSGKLCFSAS